MDTNSKSPIDAVRAVRTKRFGDLRRSNDYAARVARMLQAKRQRRIERVVQAQRARRRTSLPGGP